MTHTAQSAKLLLSVAAAKCDSGTAPVACTVAVQRHVSFLSYKKIGIIYI